MRVAEWTDYGSLFLELTISSISGLAYGNGVVAIGLQFGDVCRANPYSMSIACSYIGRGMQQSHHEPECYQCRL